MRHTLTILAAVAIGAGVLTGCGGHTKTSAYCKEARNGSGSTEIGSSEQHDYWNKLAKVAPDEIKDDVETLAKSMDTSKKLSSRMKSMDMSDPDQSMSDLRNMSHSASSNLAAVSAAGKRVMDYNKKHCSK